MNGWWKVGSARTSTVRGSPDTVFPVIGKWENYFSIYCRQSFADSLDDSPSVESLFKAVSWLS
jgi:hypothetical protein